MMTDTQLQPDMPMAPKYGSLKVLTILTFIGSGIAILSGIYQYINAEKSLAAMEKLMNSPDFAKLPDFAKSFYSPEAMELMRKAATNKLPILVVTLIGAILCILGAIDMRKLKMQGYYMWLIGELFPVIATVILLGMASISGWTAYFGYAFLLLFIILYTTQRKYLIY
ncbi:MAG: hypothetical protein GTN67_15055 [Hydrotalea flava]|uniref:hypothetical protein n=1 Tax=Hydrotalea TaxID=1004300 RepID=UPI001027557C|nr:MULTISPECIES: hypothetical protein [Hydrotalea]MBY0346831.1 hypothetical protein [Hydrotalea flava]NIM36588.1 hypothetical protein [Hydrotalea flava]NIM39448.1 hypothetical protein [Hydrotalea flava]NIN04637.1 hypothetical protein [Hydrotalea flava]NIN16309.1 hypothetical protein [Hydrotalea flava]